MIGKKLNRKKVIILGSSGYIGSFLSSKLKEKYNLINHSRKKIKDKNFNLSIKKHIYGDITRPKTLDSIIKLRPDIIIYTLSLNHKISERNLEFSIKNNFLPLANLSKKILLKKNYKPKIIYLSTVQVYGREYGNKISINEKFRKKIDNIYALTHSMCEDFLSINKDKIKSHSLRISNTFGMPILKNIDCWWLVLNEFCKTAFEKKKIFINSDGSALRDFVSLQILKKVIIKLIEKNYNMPLINVCSGKTLSIKELAQKVKNNRFFKNKKVDIILKVKNGKVIKKFKYDTSLLRKLSINSNINLSNEITKFLVALNKN
jgi:UDP-glucose 4-epimerase|tara:strand:+ start:762 stop:1715 length:954 start_codon:yes stop_codon:yes gene_type:complete